MHVLGFFRNLEVFHGVSFLTDPSEASNDNDQTVLRLVKTNPKLRRVDHWDATSNKVVVLIRQGTNDEQASDTTGENPDPGVVRWMEMAPECANDF
jgi:hypothetical protein